MKRVAANAHLLNPWLFEPAKPTDDIEPTNAWTALSSSSASTKYSFLQLSEMWRALWRNCVEGFGPISIPS